jgi:flavorubredoxin
MSQYEQILKQMEETEQRKVVINNYHIIQGQQLLIETTKGSFTRPYCSSFEQFAHKNKGNEVELSLNKDKLIYNWSAKK